MVNFRFTVLTIGCCLLLQFAAFVTGNPVQKLSNLPKQIKELMSNNKTTGKLHRGDIIPNLPNVLRHPNETSFSVDSENAKGSLTLAQIVATGLDSLVDDVTINLITMKASATLVVPSKVWISGDYVLDGKVNPGEDESTSVSGQGAFTASLTNLNVIMDARLDVGLLTGRVSISNLDLHVAYDSISINAENFALNDETVDWVSVNSELNDNFESIWSQYQEPLVVALTEGINELISDATVSDLVDVFQGKKTFEQLINSSSRKTSR